MKGLLSWLGRVAAGALTLVLIIVLTPHISNLASYILPEPGAVIHSAAILSRNMQDTARLETMVVTGEGTVGADVNALFIGTVSSVSVSYAYTGSYGIDLSKVQMQVRGSKVTFILPAPEVLGDRAEPIEIYRNGMLDSAVRIDDMQLQELLDGERTRWQQDYLTGAHSQELRDATIRAFEGTIATWMSQSNSRFEYKFVWADAAQ